MDAAEKMHAYGMKALSDRVERDLSVVYRWRKALQQGRGITDTNKKLLIAATAGSAHAIYWSDFRPAVAEAA